MVKDFTNRGNRLVDNYEKTLGEQFDSETANNDQKQQKLVKTFEKVQADRTATSKAVGKLRVRDMKIQWERRQEGLMNKMAAALEACGE